MVILFNNFNSFVVKKKQNFSCGFYQITLSSRVFSKIINFSFQIIKSDVGIEDRGQGTVGFFLIFRYQFSYRVTLLTINCAAYKCVGKSACDFRLLFCSYTSTFLIMRISFSYICRNYVQNYNAFVWMVHFSNDGFRIFI